MAQFIRLAVNLQEGKNLDTPDVVYNRYVLGKKTEVRSQKSVEDINKDSKIVVLKLENSIRVIKETMAFLENQTVLM